MSRLDVWGVPGRNTAGERTWRGCVWFVQSRARRPAQLIRRRQRESGRQGREVRRPAAQGPVMAGFSKMGSTMAGLGAKG